MRNRQQAQGRGMAALRAQAYLEPSKPAPRWSFREPCRVASVRHPLWMCECPQPGSWLAPCFLLELFIQATYLLPVSAGNSCELLSSQSFIPTFPPVLKFSFDSSPHTHWNRQMHTLPFCPACRDPPKARCQLLQRRRDLGKRCRL